MAADRQTPWWIRLNLDDDAGTADWRTPSWCRRDLSDHVASSTGRTATAMCLGQDSDTVIRAMAQLAAQDGETAAPDHVQAVFRDLLCEFRQQADCTAGFAAETGGSMLAALCCRQAEMLGKAKARLHSSTRHRDSKTERQACGPPCQHRQLHFSSNAEIHAINEVMSCYISLKFSLIIFLAFIDIYGQKTPSFDSDFTTVFTKR
jgi:hypothetical protein